jgi:hypothetical protein
MNAIMSDCAPNRNPAHISFAVVDRRLSAAQRKEVSDIGMFYDVNSYYCEFGDDETRTQAQTVCVIDAYDHSLCYVDRNGNVKPCI